MHDGQHIGPVLAERSNCLGEVAFGPAGKVMVLRIFADEHCQTKVRDLPQDRRMPSWRKILPRRQVAPGARAWAVEVHRKNREPRGVSKLILCHTQPRHTLRAARVVPGDAGSLRLLSGRLTDDRDPSGRVRDKYRPNASLCPIHVRRIIVDNPADLVNGHAPLLGLLAEIRARADERCSFQSSRVWWR